MTIPRDEGRRAFGNDPGLYDRGRPSYPARVFELLRERCGLGPYTRLLELGAGTGQATRVLVEAGVTNLTAIEPDSRLAGFLGQALPQITVRAETFEAAALPDASFDLAIAATSFHWLEAAPALAKLRHVLRPGGWWAAWWNIFTDPSAPDPLREATQPLFAGLEQTPGFGDGSRLPFGLDTAARLGELRAAGFERVESEVIVRTVVLDTEAVLTLYATFSQVARLADGDRARFLEDLRRIIDDRFGGRVERRFLTPLYLARRPL